MNLHQFSKRQIHFGGGKARMTAILYVLILLLFGASSSLDAQTLDSFAPNVGSAPNTIAIQTDGKIIVGGGFISGQNANRLARLNADGSLDTSFAPFAGSSFFSGAVFDIVILPDGKIIFVGNFSVTIGGQTRNLIARLNANGSLDTTFVDPGLSATGLSLFSVALQSDGKIITGGSSNSSINGSAVRRFNTNGTIDTTFSTPTILSNNTNFRTSLIVQSDDKIVFGGSFPTVNGQSRPGIVRLNADGTVDASFNPNLNVNVSALELQADGKILVANGNQVQNAPRVFRINPNGSFDTSFTSVTTNGGVNSVHPLGAVLAFLPLPNGKILIGGNFSEVGGQPRPFLAQLNSNGTLDTSFRNLMVNNVVLSFARQPDGRIIFSGDFTSVDGQPRTRLARITLSDTPAAVRTPFDFDGDGKADVSVFRPSNGVWYLQQSANGFTGIGFGQDGDVITPADYDGDGRADVAVYRAGVWYLQRSSLGFTGISFGQADDIPQPADYDGDGRADIAVFRPSNGTWYLLQSTLGFTGIQFGANGDKPVAADYDGDGRADVAVYRAGTWYIQRSSLGFTGVAFGLGDDKPVPADYDGDGKTDVAVFRDGIWYLQRSQLGFTGIGFGLATDLPVPADYDGDGKADVAVFRDGTWYLQRSTAGFTGVSFGSPGDKPAPNAYVR